MGECEKYEGLLDAYYDRELPPSETAAIERHVSRCGHCQGALRRTTHLTELIRQAAPKPNLEGFVGRVMASLNRHSVRPGSRHAANYSVRKSRARLRFVKQTALVAGGMAAGAAAILLLQMGRHSPERLARDLGESLVHEVAQGVHEVENEAVRVASDAITANVGSSETVITRLESDLPHVGIWSSADADSVVIWLTDETAGDR